MSSSLLLHRVPRKVGEWTIPDLSPYAFFRQTFTLSTDDVDGWTDESGNGRHLTPLTTSPPSIRYLYGGYRGVGSTEVQVLASEKTFTRPWEFWFVVYCDSLGGAQDILQNNAESDIVRIGSTGTVQVRIGGAFKTVAGPGSIAADTRYLIGIWSDASGNLECEINGVTQGQGQSSTSDFATRRIGDGGAAADSYLAAIALFDSKNLTATERGFVRRHLNPFVNNGSIHVVGISNSWDACQGNQALGGVRFPEDLSGYNSKPLFKDEVDVTWYDKIGDGDQWTTDPWLTFRTRATKTDAAGLQIIDALWVHIGISGIQSAMTSAHQIKLAAVIDAAVQELEDQGYFADKADCPVYVSPLATYSDDTTCTGLGAFAVPTSAELAAWASGGGITNCSMGPILPTITETVRSDVGGSTGACHVAEYWKKDDGLALQGLWPHTR